MTMDKISSILTSTMKGAKDGDLATANDTSTATQQPADSDVSPNRSPPPGRAESIHPSDVIVTFNVGGVIFQTLESTLRFPKRPVFKLRDLDTLERHWDEGRGMYFFDRDPAAFQAVLNYMRTGVLHLPHNMCSPQITTELLYWGVPRIDIQPCCWKDYSMGIQSIENLRKLEKDRRPAYANPHFFDTPVMPTTAWGRWRAKVWNMVSDPSSSHIAKMYGWSVIAVIIGSIITFCMSTLPSFKDNEVIENIDLFFAIFFTFDLVAHVLTMPTCWAYLLTMEAFVDIISVAPDIINMFFNIIFTSGFEGLSAMFFLRSLRSLRTFRLFRRVKHLWIIVYTLKASLKDFLIMFFLFLVIVVIFSGIMFHLEDNSTFYSIPQSFWWGVVTMTTVGYGDIVPQTIQGKLLGSVAAFVGVVTLGLTIPTLSHNFISFSESLNYMTDREEYSAKLMKKQNIQRYQSTTSFI